VKKRRQALAAHPVVRILIIWLIQALALLLLALLLNGLSIDRAWNALVATAVIGLLNALLWPLLSYVLLPFAILTLGLLTLVLNGAVIWLAGFEPNATTHLRRTDSFPDAPDVLVKSFYWAETDEVAAFEELVGSHGGLGGFQTQPFVMYPSRWQTPEGDLVGAAAVYRQFKSWLGQLQPQATPRDPGSA
jgi:uncharacterized membrane protein YvlD (DUF360 family)